MYNFNFLKNEKLIQLFEDLCVKEGNNEKITTVALTNQRLLFLDYDNNDTRENLRISNKFNYIRTKEAYYVIELKDIKEINKKENYIIYTLNHKIEFDNKELFKLLNNIKKKK